MVADQTCLAATLERLRPHQERAPLFRQIFKDNKTVDVEPLSASISSKPNSQLASAPISRKRNVGCSSPDTRCAPTRAFSADIEERYVQKQRGHASTEMTRKYQRRRAQSR
ncbi:hypothetical protein ACFSOZ_24425 [Mesorhizobium newzealandense]|uniref:Uncharacterized protein n=1 Tax=Mesorhizobium newzealandense TaxID=1300302 RepID=A0ABW4UHC6_9HYPH